MRPEAVNATSAHSTTPPSSSTTRRVPVTSRRPEFPCEGVFTGLWGPRRGSWGPPDRSAHAARGRQHVLRGSAREARAQAVNPPVRPWPGRQPASLSCGRRHLLLKSRRSGPRDRPRSPKGAGPAAALSSGHSDHPQVRVCGDDEGRDGRGSTLRDHHSIGEGAHLRRSARVSPAFGARQTGAIFGPSGPLGFPSLPRNAAPRR